MEYGGTKMELYKKAYLKMFNAATDCTVELNAAMDDWFRQKDADPVRCGQKLAARCEAVNARLRAAQTAAEEMILAGEE